MQAVWSFWSKPYATHHHRAWLSDRHHLLAWVLSLETAKRHYPATSLMTDDAGARLLVDKVGLEFTTVSTGLSALADADPDWWVLGKLLAYRAQTAPFVHLDSDVFLWKRLPPHVEGATVFAQNPESFPLTGYSWYRPGAYDTILRSYDGWTPEEWRWYTSRRRNQAVCCGILGGTSAGFLAYYADLAIQMIEHPRNAPAWRTIGSRIGDNILLEQYLLAACLEFHRHDADSPYAALDVRYLFESSEDAFDEGEAARVGYTHLIGSAKSNPALMARLEERVRRDYPDLYDRCVRCTGIER